MILSNFLKIFISLITISLSITACQCPTEIVTPKESEPVYSARVLFINAIPNSPKSEILNNNRSIITNFDYTYSNFIYNKISAGMSTIKLRNSPDSLLFNTSCILDTNANYTMIFFSKGNLASSLMLSDTIKDYSANNVYYRFIHTLPAYSNVIFKITDTQTSNMASCTATALTPIYSGTFTVSALEVATQKNIALKTNVVLNPGKIYNIVLRGDSTKIDLLITESVLI